MADGSWVEWSQHVLHELERLDECYKGLEQKQIASNDCIKKLKLELQQELEKVRLEQAKLKTKIAFVVAILTTLGNGLLYGAVKLLWSIF